MRNNQLLLRYSCFYQRNVSSHYRTHARQYHVRPSISKHNSYNYKSYTSVIASLTLCTLSAYTLIEYYNNNHVVHCDNNTASNKQQPSSKPIDDDKLPVYTWSDLKKHNGKQGDKRIWVTFSGYMYDITDFIDQHPGGSQRILLAAGGDTTPFWSIYQQHYKPEVQEILNKYLIGELDTTTIPAKQQNINIDDPYSNEPERNPALQVISERPYNAETPTPLLQPQITPNELFYVRNHMYTPIIDSNNYKLVITGNNVKHTELTLDDIKNKFKSYTVEAALQCAGNRRHEQIEIKPIKGLDWQCGAISNSIWTGAKLRDVLEYAGLDIKTLHKQQYDNNDDASSSDNKTVKHVQFEGLDVDKISNTGYGASIPVEQAISNTSDVLLAYRMNNTDLPADHGVCIIIIA